MARTNTSRRKASARSHSRVDSFSWRCSFTSIFTYSGTVDQSCGVNRVVPDKAQRRIPPWERAKLNFKLAERKRLRELEEKERPARMRMSDLEENRIKLAAIKKHICPTCQRYKFSEQLPEGERKIGERFGYCQCNSDAGT